MLSSFFLLLLILIGSAPPSAASVPYLGVYYAVNIFLVIVSLVMSIVSVNLAKKGDSDIPFPFKLRGPLRVLCRCFLPGRKLPDNPDVTKTVDHYTESSSSSHNLNTGGVRESEDAKPQDEDAGIENPTIIFEGQSSPRKSPPEQLSNGTRGRKEAWLPSDENAPSSEATRKAHQQSWKILADGLDRIFFIIQLTLVVVAAFVLFPTPANKR